MALTKGNSVVWTNDIGKGITMNVSVSEYYDTSTGKFYVGVDTVQILSQTDWYIGYSYYLDGTITVGSHTILNASGYAGTFGTGWMGSYNVYYPFGSLSNAAGSYNTGWLASCSNGSSMSVSVNLTVLRPTGYTDAAHGVNLTGSQTLSFKHSTGHTNTATGNLRSAATCTAAATYWYKCTGCGAQSTSYFSSGSALGHKSVYGGTSGVHIKCSTCGATLSATHSYSSSVQNAATCTEKGTTKYSCECGYNYTSQDIPALGHNYIGTVINPTCTEQGYTTYKCTRCNDTSKANDNYIDALGRNHNYVAEITVKPTHISTGIMTHTCTVCGHSYTEVLPKITGNYATYLTNKNGTSKHIPYVRKNGKWIRYTSYIRKNTWTE